MGKWNTGLLSGRVCSVCHFSTAHPVGSHVHDGYTKYIRVRRRQMLLEGGGVNGVEGAEAAQGRER